MLFLRKIKTSLFTRKHTLKITIAATVASSIVYVAINDSYYSDKSLQNPQLTIRLYFPSNEQWAHAINSHPELIEKIPKVEDVDGRLGYDEERIKEIIRLIDPMKIGFIQYIDNHRDLRFCLDTIIEEATKSFRKVYPDYQGEVWRTLPIKSRYIQSICEPDRIMSQRTRDRSNFIQDSNQTYYPYTPYNSKDSNGDLLEYISVQYSSGKEGLMFRRGDGPLKSFENHTKKLE